MKMMVWLDTQIAIQLWNNYGIVKNKSGRTKNILQGCQNTFIKEG